MSPRIVPYVTLRCEGYAGKTVSSEDQRRSRLRLVAPKASITDLVVCHQVVYNATDLAEFATALTEHAAGRAVLERQTSRLRGPLQLCASLSRAGSIQRGIGHDAVRVNDMACP